MGLLVRAVGRLPVGWIKAVSRLQWRHPLLKRGFEFVANRMRHQDGRIAQGIGKGLAFNTGNSTAGMMLGTTEPELQEAFELFVEPGMTIYDVGANVGFFSVISARLTGSSGRVESFDPLESNVKMVQRNAQLNGFAHVTVHSMALGDDDGEATFLISDEPNWGKLKGIGVPNAVRSEQRVAIHRIDSLVRDGLPAASLMKIDVEGAEVDVLQGAREMLRTARPILFVDLHGTNDAVAKILEEATYEARVIGTARSASDIRTANWDVQVIAVPREARSLVAKLEGLASRVATA